MIWVELEYFKRRIRFSVRYTLNKLRISYIGAQLCGYTATTFWVSKSINLETKKSVKVLGKIMLKKWSDWFCKNEIYKQIIVFGNKM